MTRVRSVAVLGVVSLSSMMAISLIGCGGGGGGGSTPPPLPVPVISNINSSTTPSSPVGLVIEVNGSGFQSAPGEVDFTQSSTGIVAKVVPNAAGWSDSSIVVMVPTGSATAFTVPGTVTVTVVTSGGTSNGVNLALVQMVSFSVNNVTWTTTTPLPTATTGLTGLRAAPVPVSTTSAFAVVTGGFDGVSNKTTVLSNTLNPDGTVGANWNAILTNPLPAPRAHHGMVVAHPGNSLVPVDSRFVYVIGGQADSKVSPGGTSTVFMASVSTAAVGLNVSPGAVGPWTTLSSSLPQELVGPAVTIYNGFIYVVGGLTTSGLASSNVYSAAVHPDGTLSPWSTSPNSYPMGVSFATAFGFGGNLYVLNGDTQTSSPPNAQGTVGIQDVRLASAHNGAVGTWTLTQTTIKKRKKHITWLAFGQVIDAEGIYDGSPGSLELERTSINPDSTLASWNGITAATNQPGANVYNAAAFVSPLQSASGNPRFLLLGGQTFSSTAVPGPLNNAVHVNNAP